MKVEKPRKKGIHVTLQESMQNGKKGKSKSFTVYETSLEELYHFFMTRIEEEGKNKRCQ